MVLLLVFGVKYFMPPLDLDCSRLAVISCMRLEGKLTLLAGKKLTNVYVWLQIIKLSSHFSHFFEIHLHIHMKRKL